MALDVDFQHPLKQLEQLNLPMVGAFTPKNCAFTPNFYSFKHKFLQRRLFCKLKHAIDRV